MERTRRIQYARLSARRDVRLLFAGSMTGGASRGSRPYYLLHYITGGSGTVSIGGNPEILRGGDLFVHYPDRPVAYRPLKEDPWTYYWMAFDGAWAHEWAEAMSQGQGEPIFRGDYEPVIREHFEALLSALSSGSMAAALRSEALMRMILSSFLDHFSRDTDVSRADTPTMAVRAAQNFILTHFAETITVGDVCAAAGYERTYFSDLFRQQTGQTMQEYLRGIRMTQACKLLTSTELAVYAIAERVGYAEYRSFSRSFKKVKGLSPQEYRKVRG